MFQYTSVMIGISQLIPPKTPQKFIGAHSQSHICSLELTAASQQQIQIIYYCPGKDPIVKLSLSHVGLSYLSKHMSS